MKTYLTLNKQTNQIVGITQSSSVPQNQGQIEYIEVPNTVFGFVFRDTTMKYFWNALTQTVDEQYNPSWQGENT